MTTSPLLRRLLTFGLAALALPASLTDAQAQEGEAAPDPSLTATARSDRPEDFAERGGQPGTLKLDGRLSLRDVFSVDSQTDNTIHLIFLDADFRGDDLTEVGGGRLNLRLDSRLLLDLTQDEGLADTSPFTDEAGGRQRNERRFGETQTIADVRMLYAELASLGSFDLRVGRSWFFESGGAWVDGLSARWHLSDVWSATLFGGLQPHPYTYGVAFNRQAIGLFTAAESERVSWSLGYNLNLYDGGLDRHYAASRGHWAVPWSAVKGFFLSYFLTLDLQNDSPHLTTAFANSSVWLNDVLNFGLNYARFSNIAYARSQVELGRDRVEENQRVTLGDTTNLGTYDQVRASAAQRFGTYYIYQQIDLRLRDTIDDRRATYYHFGVRDQDLFETGIFWHTRLTVRNNFASDSSQIMVELGRIFGDRLEVDGAFVYLTGRSLVAPQNQDVFLYELRGVYNFTSSLYLSLDYELTQETNITQEELETADDLLVHTIFTRLTYRL